MPTYNHPDRMAQDIVDAPHWAPIRDLHDIPLLVLNGELTIAQLRRLDEFLAYHAREGYPELTKEFFCAFAKDLTFDRFITLRRPFELLFERSPAHRELEKALACKRRGGSRDLTPYPQRRRRFSVYPQELPAAWQQALADMELGLPGVACAAPAPSMITTTRTKLCELMKVIRDQGLAPELSIETLSAYEHSLFHREEQLSPRTINSALRQLRAFGDYIGVEPALRAHFADRLRLWENKVNRTPSYKEAKVLALPTYAEIFGMAFDMFGEADRISNPRHAQRRRNVAVAITLFCPFPMRLADTYIRFGDELDWDGRNYRLNICISKTKVPYYPTIIPAFGFLIDQLVLQGSTSDHLDVLRQECLRRRRPLFVTHEDEAMHPGYVSQAWEEALKTGCHAARTKLHDELAELGQEGVELAMRACGQRSEKTAEFYRTRAYELAVMKQVHEGMLSGITEDEWAAHFD